MAFKSLSQYQEDKNGDFFVLPNDGDSADVVFLYRSIDDVLVADVHYLNTSTYKGYVHCCGAGCPACNYGDRGIRVDHKLFIPLYNIQKNKIEFWDRSTFFEQVLQKSVFSIFPNPSETVFRITRHGDAGSRDTKYEILPVGRNSAMPYEKILADLHVTLPDGYSAICREMTASEMAAALASTASTSDLTDYGYVPVPRGTQETVPSPDPVAPIPDVYGAPPDIAEAVPGYVAPEIVPDAIDAAEMSPNSDSTDCNDTLDDVSF